MSKVCANNATTGCSGVVTQRGNILCDSCIEIKKSSAKMRRDGELDQFIERNKILEEKLKLIEGQNLQLRNELNEATEKVKMLSEESKKIGLSQHLENESNRLSEMLTKLMSENESLVREKGTFDIVHQQLTLDIEKLNVENEKLSGLVEGLTAENKKLQQENKNLFDALEAKPHPPQVSRVVSMPLPSLSDTPPIEEQKPPSKIIAPKVVKKPTIPKANSVRAASPKSKLASRFLHKKLQD